MVVGAGGAGSAIAHALVMAGVRELASRGFVTGASGRNWAGYGADVVLPERLADMLALPIV